MAEERGWLAEFDPAPRATARGAARHWRGMRIGNLWIEAAVFLLLVCTAAALLFRGALVERHLVVDPASAAEHPVYAYADQSSGGKSVASVTDPRSLSWACEIQPGYAYPFCGLGLDLTRVVDVGVDFSRFRKVVLDISYAGPSKRMKLAFKNRDLVDGRVVAGEAAKPVAIEFEVRQGRQTVELDMTEAAVESWWVEAHAAAMPRAAEPRLDNVVAVDLHTPPAPAEGRYRLSVHRMGFSGSAFTVEQWYLLILGAWIGLIALLLVFRLVTLKRSFARRQRRHQQEARYLEAARHSAESASQAKSRFLAHMSHELRTPLNAILGYAQMLRAADLDERHRRAAGTIYDSGAHLLTLIGDILDHSKIAAGKLELEIAAIDPRELVRTVVEMIRGRAEENAVSLNWRVTSDVPRRVMGDEKHLRQVLINLLGNAVKFTPRGEVSLDLCVALRGAGDVTLRFEVRDTGEGIAEARQALIFQPFEQAGDLGANAGGTGLGLSISQQLVELMGGRIEFVSSVGQGSRFWFDVSMPLAETLSLPASEAAEVVTARRALPPAPAPEALAPLLEPARTGDMRAIRSNAERLIRENPEHHAFYKYVIELAGNYQSAALLEIIEGNCSSRLAA